MLYHVNLNMLYHAVSCKPEHVISSIPEYVLSCKPSPFISCKPEHVITFYAIFQKRCATATYDIFHTWARRVPDTSTNPK